MLLPYYKIRLAKHTFGGYLAYHYELHEILYHCVGSSAQQTGVYQQLLAHELHAWYQREMRNTGALAIEEYQCMRHLTAAQEATLSQGPDTIIST